MTLYEIYRACRNDPEIGPKITKYECTYESCSEKAFIGSKDGDALCKDHTMEAEDQASTPKKKGDRQDLVDIYENCKRNPPANIRGWACTYKVCRERAVVGAKNLNALCKVHLAEAEKLIADRNMDSGEEENDDIPTLLQILERCREYPESDVEEDWYCSAGARSAGDENACQSDAVIGASNGWALCQMHLDEAKIDAEEDRSSKRDDATSEPNEDRGGDAMAKEQKKKAEMVHVDHGDVKQITVPPGMSYKLAIDWLNKKITEEETEIAVHEEIEAFPLDGAYAFYCVLQERYGWTELIPTGFFRSPPVMIGLQVSPTETVQVPWGSVAIPGIDGSLQTHADWGSENPKFIIRGTTRQKFKKEIATIAKLTRERIKTKSIFRNQATVLRWKEEGDGYHLQNPTYMEVNGIGEKDLLLNEEIAQQVKASLFTPIEQTERCRAHGIPLKRGVMLEGKYGTGKTLTARVAAAKCIMNGWTFFYVDDAQHLARALSFARGYQPCVIFAEDIDLFMKNRDSDDVNEILNAVDGIDSKKSEIMVVLTTNSVDTVVTPMLRPGRLDAVISMLPPDDKTVEKLLRMYAGPLLEDVEDLSEASKRLSGNIPAIVREVVERAKLHAIARGGSVKLAGEDLDMAARGMLRHLALLEDRPVDARAPIEKAAAILGEAIVESAEKKPATNGKRDRPSMTDAE